MKRRDFVKASLGLPTAGLATVPAAVGQGLEPASRPRPGILTLAGQKQLFLDDWMIEEANRISRFMYRPWKYPGNPILQRDRPWEMGDIAGYFRGVQIFGQSVTYDEEEQIFKMWYLPWGFRDGSRLWCYAVSQDGYNWEKPELGIYDFQGSTQNNILANFGDPNYFNVIKDPHDPDPQRRYKALGEQEGPVPNHTGGAAVAFSPDGLRWTPWPGNPVIRHGRNLGDAPTLMGWDPLRKKHVLYPRPGHPLAMEIHGNGVHRHIRTIGYSESEDFRPLDSHANHAGSGPERPGRLSIHVLHLRGDRRHLRRFSLDARDPRAGVGHFPDDQPRRVQLELGGSESPFSGPG